MTASETAIRRGLRRCGVAALVWGWWLGGTASAQPTTQTVPDTMAQRLLACTPCHGEQGVSTNHGYLPRIAGKPAGYLYNQLLNFREGRRNNPTMSRFTATFSDDYMRSIAQHFGALDLPYPSPRTEAVAAPVLARGRLLVEHGDPQRGLPACMQCHGSTLMGVAPAIPGLLGLPTDYLLSQLGAWRTGLRRAQAPDCMHSVAKRLSEPDLVAVASYLAAQAVPAGAKPADGLTAQTHLPLACGGVPS